MLIKDEQGDTNVLLIQAALNNFNQIQTPSDTIKKCINVAMKTRRNVYVSYIFRL